MLCVVAVTEMVQRNISTFGWMANRVHRRMVGVEMTERETETETETDRDASLARRRNCAMIYLGSWRCLHMAHSDFWSLKSRAKALSLVDTFYGFQRLHGVCGANGGV